MKSLAGLPQLLLASNGQNGMSKKQHGKKGADGVYLVPLGTQVRALVERDSQQFRHSIPTRNESNENIKDEDIVINRNIHKFMSIDLSEEDNGEVHDLSEGPEFEFVGDLLDHNDEIVVAHGGNGGKGNSGQVSVRHRAKIAQPTSSTLGEVVRLSLEMKLISDVSFIGLPNVGKSSLLRAISSAAPRVDNYAFTTTTPQLGSVRTGADQFTVSDVPGLIQGAHNNRGVGHRFLRHVERTKAFVFVLDIGGALALSGEKGEDPLLSPEEQFLLLRRELGQYSHELLRRRHMIVLNKIDLLERPSMRMQSFMKWMKTEYSREGSIPVVCVSATGGQKGHPVNSEILIDTMHSMLNSVTTEEI